MPSDRLATCTVLVSTAEGGSPLDWVDGRPSGVTVLRRPNLGYDFGSWATALDLLPAIRRAPHVLLVNDSLVGPFAPIDHLLDRFHRSHADVWAHDRHEQLGHHLQSYCLGFREGCLDQPELRGVLARHPRGGLPRRRHPPDTSWG